MKTNLQKLRQWMPYVHNAVHSELKIEITNACNEIEELRYALLSILDESDISKIKNIANDVLYKNSLTLE